MKKYVAVELDRELTSWEDYFPDDNYLESKRIFIGGNRDYNTLGVDHLRKFNKLIDDLNYAQSYHADFNDTINDIIDSLFVYYSYTAPKYEARQIINILDLADRDHSSEVYNYICEFLEVIYKQPFKYGTLRGYSQGDWVYYICPEKTTADFLDQLEAAYFGTGTEFALITSPVEIDDINLGDLEYNILTYTADPKAEVAKELGVSKSEVVLFALKNSGSKNTYELS